MSKPDTLWHQSGVNQKGEPFVQLVKDGKVIGQMTPEEARDHANAVLQAAEAAETDAFLFQWAQTTLGLDIHGAMAIMMDFRKWREAFAAKSGPPADPRDFVRNDKGRN